MWCVTLSPTKIHDGWRIYRPLFSSKKHRYWLQQADDASPLDIALETSRSYITAVETTIHISREIERILQLAAADHLETKRCFWQKKSLVNSRPSLEAFF
jgi:hypothetical protein